MARPRKASKVLELKGAFLKDPQRARHDEPEPTVKLPEVPPAHLAHDAKQCWLELKRIAPDGVLFESDGPSIELCANLLAEYRLDPVAFPSNRLGHLRAAINALGMNPGERSKIIVPKKASRPMFGDL
jgi:hypothetical protein